MRAVAETIVDLPSAEVLWQPVLQVPGVFHRLLGTLQYLRVVQVRDVAGPVDGGKHLGEVLEDLDVLGILEMPIAGRSATP